MRVRAKLVILALSAGSLLAGCGSPAGVAPAASASPGSCGSVAIANVPGAGAHADLAVVAYVLKTRLGCRVLTPDLTEAAAWQGFGQGVDVVLQNGGNDDLKRAYIDQSRIAVEMGQTGNRGTGGWYVPPWLAQAHPDVTDYTKLNTFAARFTGTHSDSTGSTANTGTANTATANAANENTTSDNSGTGEFLDLDAAHAARDQAVMHNLGLDFTVASAGSEPALIDAFTQAEHDHTWLIGYFYQPQWFLADIKLVRVTLPPYTPGCDSDPATVACDYQPYDFDKIASAAFASSGSPAVEVVKNFTWTNDDQNSVARDIAENRMSDDAAAKKWVDAHPDRVREWLRGTPPPAGS